MQSHPKLQFLLWVLGATVALAASLLCVMTAANGKICAFALVPIAWTVASLAGALHTFPREWPQLLQSLAVPHIQGWLSGRPSFAPLPANIRSKSSASVVTTATQSLAPLGLLLAGSASRIRPMRTIVTAFVANSLRVLVKVAKPST